MTWTTIIGHDRPKRILEKALIRSQIAHAYLFHGKDSIGKLQIALAFAQAILCERNVSMEEGDASPTVFEQRTLDRTDLSRASVGLPAARPRLPDGGQVPDGQGRQGRGKAHPALGEAMVAPPITDGCGHCRACLAVEANTHPDVMITQPHGSQIKIDQIRAVQEALVFKPVTGSRKVVIVDDAESMNLQAANCFLKTLEEPPDHSLLILITSQPHRLPLTMLSRCQQLRFDSPRRDEIKRLLIQQRGLSESEATFFAALSMGKIGHVLSADLAEIKRQRDKTLDLFSNKALSDLNQLIGNAHSYAADDEAWKATLNWILIWLRDLLIYRHNPDPKLLINLDRKEDLARFSQRLSTPDLLKIMTLLIAFQQAAHRNLNRTLVLETILLGLRDCLKEVGS